MITGEQAQKIWDLIKPIKVGMLVTETDSALHARPMHLVQDEFDGALWFYSNRTSSKTEEIAEDAKVALTFADHGSESYVSLSGTATTTHDRAKIDQYWNPFVAAYFPKGKDDPDLTLLRIDVTAAEYWDSTSSRMVQLFKFLKANVTKEPPKMGEHRKVG